MLRLVRTAIMTAVFDALVGSLVLLNAPRSWAQTISRVEVGVGYSFVHTNAPPGGCGCFFTNGGSGWFAYNFVPSLAAVGEVGSWYASNIDRTKADLNFTSFVAGPRYTWHRGHRIAPFGQILLGGAHASGPLTREPSGVAGSANAFVMAAGGGVDVKLAPHWTVRLAQVDYYLTRFDNAGNNHQNNVRVGFGAAFHFGPRY